MTETKHTIPLLLFVSPHHCFGPGFKKREAPVMGAPIVTSRLSLAEASVPGCGALLHPSPSRLAPAMNQDP